MSVLIPIAAALCLPALRLVLGRPKFPASARNPQNPPKISIIIPARDEQENIGTLLESLRPQIPPTTEVIVVDDHSSDLTAQISRNLGAKVIAPPPLPEAWKGKPWACLHGAAAASGDHLLFLDADTRMEAGGFASIQHLAITTPGAVSICPYHRVPKPYEQLSAFFNLSMVAGIDAFGSEPRSPALFGQCLLISTADYQKVDGHNSVSGKILENFHLAKSLRKAGIPTTSLLGRGTISMRMFPAGFTHLWSGWKKGFAHGAGDVPPRTLAIIAVWMTGAILAATSAINILSPAVPTSLRLLAAVIYAAYAIQCHRAFRLIGGFHILTAIFFPIPLLFYQILFFHSLISRKLGGKTHWKGRDVD